MRTAISLAAIVALPFVGLAANIVINPGFENALASPWATNWDLGNVNPNTGLQSVGTGCGGTNCVTPGIGLSYLYQDVVTDPGATYTLSFFVRVEGTGGSTPNELIVLFDSFQVFDLKDLSPGGYAFYSKSVVAVGTGTRLEFYGRNDPGITRIDDVSLTAAVSTNAVPEPATWLLFAGGFSALVATRLSRQRKAARTT